MSGPRPFRFYLFSDLDICLTGARTGGQIGNNDSADDVRNVDLTKVHYLSGPFEVEGAKPGDLLLVEIMDVQPFESQPWGFTGIFDKNNGGGFLDEIYPSAYAFPSILTLCINIEMVY